MPRINLKSLPAPKKAQRVRYLKTVPTWSLKRQLRQVLAQKAQGKSAHQRVAWLAMLKRERDITAELLDRGAERAYKAQRESIENPLGLDSSIQAQRRLDEHPVRKADCRCANRGFYREPTPSPSGKGPGAYKTERKLRPGADKLIKDIGK